MNRSAFSKIRDTFGLDFFCSWSALPEEAQSPKFSEQDLDQNWSPSSKSRTEGDKGDTLRAGVVSFGSRSGQSDEVI